jgi:hypothetical protein
MKAWHWGALLIGLVIGMVAESAISPSGGILTGTGV